MSRTVLPAAYKWQFRRWDKNNSPLLRHMKKLTVSYYPYSPNLEAVEYYSFYVV